MDEASLEGALNELAKQFGDGVDFTHSKLADLAKKAEANRQQLQKSINTLQELLDYLRVCIKYQAFDLEATRRENTYLRKLLEENNNNNNNNRDEGGALQRVVRVREGLPRVHFGVRGLQRCRARQPQEWRWRGEDGIGGCVLPGFLPAAVPALLPPGLPAFCRYGKVSARFCRYLRLSRKAPSAP